jgi:hypothetical protein
MRETKFKRPSKVPIPAFAEDTARIDGFAIPTAEVCARLFVPGRTRCGPVAWKVVLGQDVKATTRWSQQANRDDAWQMRDDFVAPPQGHVDRRTIERLLDVVERHRDGPFVVALSRIYSDEPSARRPAPIPAESWATTRRGWVDAATVELTVSQEIDWLLDYTPEQHRRFALGLWPEALSWCVAGPVYADSFIVSSSRAMCAEFQASGLEVLTIDRAGDLPIEGD